MPDFLASGPDDAAWTLLLAHGAGAGMETPFMSQMAALLAERSVRVLRFEFGYMASRRTTGKRKPPPKAEKLIDEYRAAVSAARLDLQPKARLAIGGKSMGGRVASLIADELFAKGEAGGLVCLGYPFHPPGMPEKTRTAHLMESKMPCLIVQGERDPFGDGKDVADYALPKSIELIWIGDGDHDFGPRGASGFTRKGNLAAAANAVAAFLARA
ncbi:MAG: alpha/beta fold hydrolase [Proteobacteria bacterium]|nr:alpha/beta fold hydrolase [Pseudomonadota bacterium]